jgi:TRAP transporter TAXI family solute receptor
MRKHFLILAALILAAAARPGFADQPDMSLQQDEDRPMPAFWRDTRYNLRWAGSASNLSYITRFIAEGMLEHLGRDTGYIAYGTRGNSTSANILAVGEHEVDFAITTPPTMAVLAHAGKAYFKEPYKDLRAIAVFPQNDWVMCVADESLGVSSYEDIREKKLAVRIATNRIGKDNGVSFLVEQIFRAHGITPDDIESWGGGFIEVRGAPGAARKVLDGEADIACHEYWKAFYRLTDKRPVVFLPVTGEAMNELGQQFAYQRNTIPRDIYGPGLPSEDVLAVDYSDWLVLTNANVPDEIAYIAARVAVEDRVRGYERLYAGQTDRQRSADIPVDPKLMWKNVGVALHPGAERYYREAGLMP